MSCSVTRSLEKKRYAALVLAQSWQARGMLSPRPEENCCSSCCKRWRSRWSGREQAASSSSIHPVVSEFGEESGWSGLEISLSDWGTLAAYCMGLHIPPSTNNFPNRLSLPNLWVIERELWRFHDATQQIIAGLGLHRAGSFV